MKKLRVCHIGPDINEKGGMATVISSLLNSELKERVDMSILASYNSQNRLATFCACLKKLRPLCRNKEIDLAHIHMATRGSFLRKSIIAYICRKYSIPYIIHLHGAEFQFFYSGLKKPFKVWCHYTFNNAYKIIALSESWKSFLLNFAPENKIVVIHNSVYVKIQEPQVKNGECIHMVFAGRLGDRKGTWDLLQVAKELAIEEKLTNFNLVLIGDGEVDRAKEYIKVNKLEKIVECRGWQDTTSRDALLEISDVFVLPTYNEGLPMAMLEAMSKGLLPVVTPVGGIPEVVADGYNGYLFEPGDLDKLKSILFSILNGSANINEMRKNAYLTVKNDFNFEAYTRKFHELYESGRKHEGC